MARIENRGSMTTQHTVLLNEYAGGFYKKYLSEVDRKASVDIRDLIVDQLSRHYGSGFDVARAKEPGRRRARQEG